MFEDVVELQEDDGREEDRDENGGAEDGEPVESDEHEYEDEETNGKKNINRPGKFI